MYCYTILRLGQGGWRRHAVTNHAQAQSMKQEMVFAAMCPAPSTRHTCARAADNRQPGMCCPLRDTQMTVVCTPLIGARLHISITHMPHERRQQPS